MLFVSAFEKHRSQTASHFNHAQVRPRTATLHNELGTAPTTAQRGHTPHPSSATKKYSALRGNVLQCYEAPLASPSCGLQPPPPCALACTPLGSHADDLYTVADTPLLTHAVQAWDQHLRAARMRLHMGRLNAWCPAGQNALPPAMREHCTPELPVLGNTIEKSRGNLVRSNIGSADEAWTEIADKISGACARLRELVGAGLAHPTAQSVFRVWSGPDLNSPERR